ncbi:hypothetical protein [Nocardia sp. NBC_01388]|uniref:hypothetical protein n=1 Tax=Nocardia sp. NBC_01388 TaxID=2903596 RepID=UPI00324C4AA9
MSTTITDNKATITAFVNALNEGIDGSTTDWIAYLSPQVIDHNQVIFGEADEPGAAIEGSGGSWRRSVIPMTGRAGF